MDDIMKKQEHKIDLSFKCFKAYVQQNILAFLIGAAVIALFYGSQLFMLNPRVDTEHMINDPTYTFNWLQIGRQGAILTRILFAGGTFNPYYAGVMWFVVSILSMLILSFLCFRLGGMKTPVSIAVLGLFLVHPIYMEQFYFTLQIFEVAFGVFLTFAALWLCFAGILEDNKWLKLMAIPVMIWAFSTYQLFIILFFAAAAFLCILYYIKREKDEASVPPEARHYLQMVLQLASLFIGAFLLNTLISKFFSSGQAYLTDQIHWGKMPVSECIKGIGLHIKYVLGAVNDVYSFGYTVSVLLVLGVVIYQLFAAKKGRLIWLYLLAWAGLEVSPFLLTFYQGGVPTLRSQFVLPFVIACNLAFIVTAAHGRKLRQAAAVFVLAFIFLEQGQTVLQQQYTDNIRYQEDMRVATQIEERIRTVAADQDKPVYFVGTRQSELNQACITQGDMIPNSLFNWNSDYQPHYYGSTSRTIRLLSTQGLKLRMGDPDMMVKARLKAQNMPVWPALGSVIDVGEYVVVKLSEDKWFEEDGLLIPSAQPFNLSTTSFQNQKLRWGMDKAVIENDCIRISGWFFCPNLFIYDKKIKVYLWNDLDQRGYQISSYTMDRPDVQAMYSNEVRTRNIGFTAVAPVDQLPKDLSGFRVVLGLEYHDQTLYSDTGVSLNSVQ